MKSFWIGTIAAVFIAVLAGAILESAEQSVSVKYATGNVRL